MNMIRKTLFGVAVGVGLTVGLMAGVAHAQRCYDVTDPVRTIHFGNQAVARGVELWAEINKTSYKKEELKLWERRKKFKNKDEDEEDSEDGDESSGGGSGKLFPQGDFYDYMKNANATGSEKYLPAKSDAKEQAKYVRENFFYDSDVSKLTEEDKDKVLQRRQSYTEALAMEVLSLSAGARENISSELSALKSAKTTAGGIIQQVDLLAQTKKVMVEQKAADIMLQAKLLELESAQLLANLSPQRVEKPKESDSEDDSGDNQSGSSSYSNLFGNWGGN